jgi:hypothetical protein
MIPFLWVDRRLMGILQGVTGTPVGLILTGTVAALVFAYVVRFLAVALNPTDSGFERICGNLDETSRSLGMPPLRTLWKVDLPLLRGTLVSAGLLVFVDVLKELPLTLILRPFDFDTLATRAFQLASDEQVARSALPALLIIVVGMVPVIILSRIIARQRDLTIHPFPRGTRHALHPTPPPERLSAPPGGAPHPWWWGATPPSTASTDPLDPALAAQDLNLGAPWEVVPPAWDGPGLPFPPDEPLDLHPPGANRIPPGARHGPGGGGCLAAPRAGRTTTTPWPITWEGKTQGERRPSSSSGKGMARTGPSGSGCARWPSPPLEKATALADVGVHDTVVVLSGESALQGAARILRERAPGVIAVNSSNLAVADGLSHTQRLQLEEAFGPELTSRLVSSEELVVQWLSVKTPREVEIMARGGGDHRGPGAGGLRPGDSRPDHRRGCGRLPEPPNGPTGCGGRLGAGAESQRQFGPGSGALPRHQPGDPSRGLHPDRFRDPGLGHVGHRHPALRLCPGPWGDGGTSRGAPALGGCATGEPGCLRCHATWCPGTGRGPGATGGDG